MKQNSCDDDQNPPHDPWRVLNIATRNNITFQLIHREALCPFNHGGRSSLRPHGQMKLSLVDDLDHDKLNSGGRNVPCIDRCTLYDHGMTCMMR